MKMNPGLKYQILRRELLVSLVFTLAALAFFLAYPFFYDDAFISMRISRNIAEGLGPFHNLEERVQTNTSLLYPFLVAPFQGFGRELAIRLNVVFDFFLAFLILHQIWVAVRRHLAFSTLSLSDRTAFAICLNLAFFGNRILVPGMETQLYMLALLCTWNALSQSKEYGLSLGFACSFIRPEGALLGVIHWITGSWPARVRIWSLAAGLFMGLGYFLVQWYLFGSLVPHTIAVKAQIQPEVADSLWHFLFQVLFPYRYPVQLLVHLVGIFYLFQLRKDKSMQILSLFLGIYGLTFCVLVGGNAFFGWYQSPVKVFLLLASAWQCLEWGPVWFPKKGIIAAVFTILVLPVLSEQIRFRQDGIFKAAQDLNALTQGKSRTLTCEPLGILSYYNPHIQFRDYPGLASARSLEILKTYGPIRRSNYFDNAAFRQIILQSKADFVLLSPPEAKSFQELMKANRFLFLGKIGVEKKSEHNSAFYVWLNKDQILEADQMELLHRSREKGYLP